MFDSRGYYGRHFKISSLSYSVEYCVAQSAGAVKYTDRISTDG